MKKLSIILPTIACIMVQTMTLSGMDPASVRRQEARARRLAQLREEMAGLARTLGKFTARFLPGRREDLLRRNKVLEKTIADLTNRKEWLERDLRNNISTTAQLERILASEIEKRAISRDLKERKEKTEIIFGLKVDKDTLTKQRKRIDDEIANIDRNLIQAMAELKRNKRDVEQIEELLAYPPHLVPARAEEIEVVLPPTRPVRIEPAQPLPVPIEPVVVRPLRPLPPPVRPTLRPLPPTPEVRRRPYGPPPLLPPRPGEEARPVPPPLPPRRPEAARATLLEQIRAGRILRPLRILEEQRQRQQELEWERQAREMSESELARAVGQTAAMISLVSDIQKEELYRKAAVFRRVLAEKQETPEEEPALRPEEEWE